MSIGIAVAVIGLILFFKGMGNQSKAQVISDTPTSRTTDITSFGLHEIKGVIECDDCTETPGTGEPCVWYRVIVEQKQYMNTSKGRRSYWETTRNEEYGVSFLVRDEYGTFEVVPYGADIDVPQIAGAAEDSLLGFLKLDRLVANQRISVWALYPGTKVYVLGEVQPYGNGNAIRRSENDSPFIISVKDEEELLSSAATGAWLWMAAGGLVIIVGALMAAIGASYGT